MQPNACSNPRSTSTGRAAPPDTQVRSVDTSYDARFGTPSIAAYMVGTPSYTVTLSRPITCSAFTGSNRGIRVSVAPEAMAAFSPQIIPNTWNSGRQPITTSSGPISIRVRAVTAWFLFRPAWVSSAPFGFPVVPEV